jgi:transcriptional regulator with XRE-family HTH domain
MSEVGANVSRAKHASVVSVLSFRHRLTHEFNTRREVNQRYSVRAFASLLDVDHATLSQVLRGKRGIPADRIAPWAKKLKLMPAEIAVYCALARVAEGQADIGEIHLRQWGAEMLALLTDPIHLEILRLTREPRFRRDSRWLAKELGVGADETNIALSRLLRLGLLEFKALRWADKTELREITPRAFYKFVAERVVVPSQQD